MWWCGLLSSYTRVPKDLLLWLKAQGTAEAILYHKTSPNPMSSQQDMQGRRSTPAESSTRFKSRGSVFPHYCGRLMLRVLIVINSNWKDSLNITQYMLAFCISGSHLQGLTFWQQASLAHLQCKHFSFCLVHHPITCHNELRSTKQTFHSFKCCSIWRVRCWKYVL